MSNLDDLIDLSANGDPPDVPMDPEPIVELRNMRHDETMPEYLLAMWGPAAYYTSAYYRQLVYEESRQTLQEPLRKAFIKARA